MPSVTIDAGVLASPPAHDSAERAERYVVTLLDWSSLLDETWVDVYMSERAREALHDDGFLPVRDQLRQLFSANGIVEYDVNTVAQVVDRLLQRTPTLESHFSIRDVLPEDLSIEPDVREHCLGSNLQSDLERCVVLIAILRQDIQEPVRDHLLILRHAPGSLIRVRAQISIFEHLRTDLVSTPAVPGFFEGEVLVCDDLRGFFEHLDEATVLLKAEDVIGIETAIRIAVCKATLARAGDPKWHDFPRCRIGGEFRSSLHKYQLTPQLAKKLLRALVKTIEQTELNATHPLRTGRGGDNPQRVRQSDLARAWRRDIDRDHHLHYWMCEGNFVEFASVSFPHDNFTIPD